MKVFYKTKCFKVDTVLRIANRVVLNKRLNLDKPQNLLCVNDFVST